MAPADLPIKDNLIEVEVAYATPHQQHLFTLMVPVGSTIKEVIAASPVLQHFPEINLTRQTVGIYSQPRKLTDCVKAGDRIEMYRALLVDPKEARRMREKTQRTRDI